jgi:hypothetical protein
MRREERNAWIMTYEADTMRHSKSRKCWVEKVEVKSSSKWKKNKSIRGFFRTFLKKSPNGSKTCFKLSDGKKTSKSNFRLPVNRRRLSLSTYICTYMCRFLICHKATNSRHQWSEMFFFIKKIFWVFISLFQHINNVCLVKNTQQHCYVFPKNLITRRDSNPGL